MAFLVDGAEVISCWLCENAPGMKYPDRQKLPRYSRASDFAQHTSKTHHRTNWRTYAIIEDLD